MSSVFVVTRTTDEAGKLDPQPMAAFSTFESAEEQGKVLSKVYGGVEVHELELDLSVMVPQGEATVATPPAPSIAIADASYLNQLSNWARRNA